MLILNRKYDDTGVCGSAVGSLVAAPRVENLGDEANPAETRSKLKETADEHFVRSARNATIDSLK